MAADPEQVRKAAMAELARRELARRQKEPNMPAWQQRTREGLRRVSGVPEAAAQVITGGAAQAPAGLAGIAGTLMPGEQGQGAKWAENTANALTFQPRSEAGQQASASLSVPMQALDDATTAAGAKAKHPLAQTAVKTALLAAPMLLGVRGKPAAKPLTQPKKPPTSQQLKTQASEAYKAADDAGVIISGKSMGSGVERIISKVADEGIDQTLHPDSMAALNRLMDAAGKNHSMKGAEILRQIIKDAENSTKPADRRMAAIMRREFDDYMEGIGPDDVIAGDAKAATAALSEARSLYTRNRKSEQIEGLIERAKTRSSQFSGSGYENALRTEFRQLAMNEKKMRRFTPDEQAAIKKVAKGGPIENTLRMLGKAAPTGIVSGSLASGAGAMMFGPLGAIGLPLAGGAARQAATSLTGRNASMAAELMRRGGKQAKTPARGKEQMAIAAMLADQSRR